MKYENLQIFNGVDKKTSYRAVQLAIARSGVYRKPIVLLKLLAVFLVVALNVVYIFGSYTGGLIVGILTMTILNRVMLAKEFDEYVKPLIPMCLADVQRFPDIRK